MIYLLAKFALLFLLSAVLGFFLGHWWSRRNFEDVTESFESMRSQQTSGLWSRLWERLDGLDQSIVPTIRQELAALPTPEAVDLEPVQARFASLERAIQAIPQPTAHEPVDLGPLDQRIGKLEEAVRSIPRPDKPEPVDLEPVNARIGKLEEAVRAIPTPEKPPAVSFDPVNSRIEKLDKRIDGIHESIRSLPRPEKPQAVDFAPVHEKLGLLERSLRDQPKPEPHRPVDLAPVYKRLDDIDRTVRAIRQPDTVDLRPVNQRLDTIEGKLKTLAQMPRAEKVDLAPINTRLVELDRTVRSISKNAPPVDLAPFDRRLASIEGELKSVGAELARSRTAPPRAAARPKARKTTARETASPRKPASAGSKTPRAASGGRITTLRGTSTRHRGRPQLLRSASHGSKDDLKQISGVGPKLERLLNRNGVYYFWQVASWDRSDIEYIDERLDTFKGRIARDNWVRQARSLRKSPGAAVPPADA